MGLTTERPTTGLAATSEGCRGPLPGRIYILSGSRLLPTCNILGLGFFGTVVIGGIVFWRGTVWIIAGDFDVEKFADLIFDLPRHGRILA